MMQHTSFIVDNIGCNRVTLDIRPNRFQEPYSYEPDALEKEFKGIENVLDLFLSAKKRPRSPRVPEQPKGFLYSVLVSLDPTLSLVDNRQLFVDKFASELKDKARNFDTKLKRYGFKVEQAVAAVDDPSEALYRYVSLLIDKSVMIEPSMEMYENYGTKQCLVVNPDQGTSRIVELVEAYAAMYESRVASEKASMTLEKLNGLLVKELKDLAVSIGIETSKVEDGKRRNLLKSELRDKIKGKLLS